MEKLFSHKDADSFDSDYLSDPGLRQHIVSYRERLPDKVRILTALHEAGDLAGLARTSHKYSGSLSVYGFSKLADIAAKIETVASSSEDFEHVKDLLVEFTDAVGKVCLFRLRSAD